MDITYAAGMNEVCTHTHTQKKCDVKHWWFMYSILDKVINIAKLDNHNKNVVDDNENKNFPTEREVIYFLWMKNTNVKLKI